MAQALLDNSFTAQRPTRPVIAVDTTADLLRHRLTLGPTDPSRAHIRNRVIEANLPMAHRLARRYKGRGEPHDDLAQAAALGLIKAVDSFDPTRQVPFVGYAMPSIAGALKRHFRDTTWTIRVPRATQELSQRVGGAIDTVSQAAGHTASTAELAKHLGVTVTDVVAAKVARHAYLPLSLDASRGDAGRSDGALADLASRFGAIDPSYEQIEDQVTLRPMLAALPPRMRRILELRFTDELSQSQIAAVLGLSQMHISRLLSQALTILRNGQPDRCDQRGGS